MKYCTKCGNELMDEAVICPKCGCLCAENRPITTAINDTGLKTATKVLMIASCALFAIVGLVTCIYLTKTYYVNVPLTVLLCFLPIFWTVPMTVCYLQKLKKDEKISTTFKICSLLFVNDIAGVLMLLDKD